MADSPASCSLSFSRHFLRCFIRPLSFIFRSLPSMSYDMLNELGDIYQKMERGIRYTIVSLAACTIIVYPFLFMYISSFSSYTFVVQLMLATGTAGAYLSLTTLVSCPVQPPPYAVFVPIPVLAFGELIYLYLIESKGIQISLACYWTRFLVLYSSVAYFSILLLFAKICLGKITLGGKHCWQLLKKKVESCRR